MANSAHATCIMNLIKEAIEDFKKARTSNKQTAHINEVTDLNIGLCSVIISNLIEKSESDKQELRDEIKSEIAKATEPLLNKIDKLEAENADLRFGIDSASQYSRRENLKFTGVPYEKDENLRDIVKHIHKHTTGNDLEDRDISVVHRIGIPKSEQQTRNQAAGSDQQEKPSNIIVRYTVRDIKSKQYKERKEIRDTPGCKYPNAAIYEDVTPLRSRMMYELRNRLDSANNKKWKFVWSRDGKIFVRTEAEALMDRESAPKPKCVQRPEDLKNLGFSDAEIQVIIMNKRTTRE